MHTHDEQFAQWKPLVDSLVRAQEKLCARFLSEAEALIKKLNPTDGSNVQNAAGLEHEIGLLLFRVKTGQPKSEGLMKILENPEYAGMMNRAELSYTRIKRKLIFTARRKSCFSRLTKKVTRPTSRKKAAILSARKTRTRSCCRI
jgi:hypothetical protein